VATLSLIVKLGPIWMEGGSGGE